VEAKKVKERYVMSEIRSFDERFRIAYCKGGEKERREREGRKKYGYVFHRAALNDPHADNTRL